MAVEPREDEFFDDLEVMTPAAREEYLASRLSETVENAYQKAPAIREMFDRIGVSPSDIRLPKDLEKLPIIRKTDLIDMQKQRPPYGGLVTIPFEEIERVFISPGPIYEPVQFSNIKWFAKAFWAAGFRKGDVVVNTFTYHMSPAGILFHEALRDCGATVIPMGTGNTDALVQTIYDLRVTGFVGTPSFLMTVIQRSGELGYDFRRDLPVVRAWFTGEMLPHSVRQTLENDYGIVTSQAYAVTEPGGAIAYECSQQTGLHMMDDYVIEIVDPQTGIQMGPGEVGEIVVTPIHNRVWGLIRFGTGDLSSYSTEPCACGRTSCKIMGIVGRAMDAVKVRGMFVVARQAEQAIASFEEVNAFQIVVDRVAQRDELNVKIELADEAADRARLTHALSERFQQTCRVKIDRVDFVAKGSIAEDQPRIIDQRRWD